MVRDNFLPMVAGSHMRPTNPVDWRFTFSPSPCGSEMASVSRRWHAAAWRRDGQELFFLEPGSGRMMAVDVMTDAKYFRSNKPHLLFQLPATASTHESEPGSHYGVTPDGQRFLVILANDESPGTRSTSWSIGAVICPGEPAGITIVLTPIFLCTFPPCRTAKVSALPRIAPGDKGRRVDRFTGLGGWRRFFFVRRAGPSHVHARVGPRTGKGKSATGPAHGREELCGYAQLKLSPTEC